MDAPIVSQETANQVLQRLDALAAKLGVTAQYIYGVYVAQARVEAVRDSLFAVLGVFGVCVSIYLFRWAWRHDDTHDSSMYVGMGSIALFVFSAATMLVSAYAAIGEWMNPQFWALDALFKAIKG